MKKNFETVSMEMDGTVSAIPLTIYENVHTVFLGPRGEEKKFKRTERKCPKGRTIFTHTHHANNH